MSTANDFIVESFSRINIRDSETSLTAGEVQTGLNFLNDMLSIWEPQLGLGFSPVMDVADEVRVPRYSHLAIKDSLAILLAPEFSKPITPDLRSAQRDSFSNLLNIRVDLSNVDYPSTLPLGSGNEWCLYEWRTFFPQMEKRNF